MAAGCGTHILGVLAAKTVTCIRRAPATLRRDTRVALDRYNPRCAAGTRRRGGLLLPRQ